MEPKFQTSFIPKGNFASPGAASINLPRKEKSLFSIIGIFLFTAAVIAAVGVFGYARFLSYQIGKMGTDLTNSRNSIEPETVNQLIQADARIASTQSLLNSHTIISPLFALLEENTLKTVRFTDFSYNTSEKGVQLIMKGEARGYQAIALQSEAFSKIKYFKKPLFSDLRLDNKGNVTFSFTTIVDPSLLSYSKSFSDKPIVPIVPAVTEVATTTSTTTPSTNATSTPRSATSTQSTTTPITPIRR